MFTNLTAIIVDDELFGRENLKKIIESYCHEIKILGCADSVNNAKKLQPSDIFSLRLGELHSDVCRVVQAPFTPAVGVTTPKR